MNANYQDILHNRFFLFSLFFLSAVLIGKLLTYETVQAACFAALLLLLIDVKKPVSHSECSPKTKLESPRPRSLVMCKPRIYDESFMEYIDKRVDELDNIKAADSAFPEHPPIITISPQASQEMIRLPEPLPKKPVPNLSIQIMTK
ncbi:MAG: hypothetical protein ACM3PP_08790 [Candidatus Saccharibacteria bacterium]